MPFVQQNGLRYYTFESFPGKLTQAIFTRRGGVSPRPWDSLNVGGSIGDEIERVRENRIRSFQALGRDPHSIFDVWQVHSADVVVSREPRALDSDYQQADVILTDNPDVTLFMRFADCTPIFLHDPVKRVIGIVHAGWLGTVRGAARAAVQAMGRRFRCQPADIQAGIGPSIGPDHYEIGPDVVARVRETFGERSDQLLEKRGDNQYFDLWEANKTLLQDAGLEQIEISGLCTACRTGDWYSHRAEKGKTGRFGALLAMNS